MEVSPGENLQPKFIDFAQLAEVVSTVEGYPYPDWEKIHDHIHKKFPHSDWKDAWREAVVQWLEKFRTVLKPNYFLNESDNFFLVSHRAKGERQDMLNFVEKIRRQLQDRLRGIELRETFGKQVILIFEEPDDYYRYISHFYPDGNYSLSWGVFLKKGYGHIAVPFYDPQSIRSTLGHELAHNALFTLPVPRWLNEGVAKIFETQIAPARGTGFDADMDLSTLHHTYWTPKNIQAFWSGEAFHCPNSVKLSYSLANIFIHLIAREKGDFKKFLQHAKHSDSGEAAFRNAYGKSLGQVAEIFLGQGDWAPHPETSLKEHPQKRAESSKFAN